MRGGPKAREGGSEVELLLLPDLTTGVFTVVVVYAFVHTVYM